MILVDFIEFTSLPKGTLYCEVDTDTYFCGEFKIKETITNTTTWHYSEFTGEPEYPSWITYQENIPPEDREKGSLNLDNWYKDSSSLSDSINRKFIVYSKEDVQNLIDKLKTLL